MLNALSIRNILLIESLDLEFQRGLNVLTGETGAGKSILLDSLGFVLGWRGKSDIVRQGAEQGEVTAEFQIDETHPAWAVLETAGFTPDETLILRRSTSRSGRKRAFVNDQSCSGDLLRQLAGSLVEIHGQHDDKGLLDPKGHRRLLDEFAGTTVAAKKVRRAWKNLSDAGSELDDARATLEEAARDAEFLRHAVGELDELSPESGEDADLDRRRRTMQGAARVREGIEKASVALSIEGSEGSLSDAIRWLEDAAPNADGRLDEPINALGRTLSELADVQRGVDDALRELSFDSFDLEQVEERLFAIRALARKHQVLPDDLALKAEEFRLKLVEIDTGGAHIKTLEEALWAAKEKFDEKAKTLSKQRVAAALKLDKAMMLELAPLKMERAVFETVVEPNDVAGPEGLDRIGFTVATNPGAPSGPINKIASGGELSRFLLALKVCLTGHDSGVTMIFDEIDRGVGGATADAVGRRLASLAASGQVLVVTHSPQVAALGGHHWLVSKSVQKGTTITDVSPLDQADRIAEIARMLSGENVTSEARSAAEVLLGA